MPRRTISLSGHRPLIGGAGLLLPTALFCLMGANAAFATAAIINFPYSASPNDVISLEGSGFGSKPTVYIQAGASAAVQVAPLKAQDNIVVVQIPASWATGLYTIWISDNVSSTSNKIAINAPQVANFQFADIYPGQTPQIFGRNVCMKGQTAAVTLVDTQTNAQLPASLLGACGPTISVAYHVPAGIIPGHTYQAIVSNGYASSVTQNTALAHAAGTDHFRIGQAWAMDYVTANGPGYKPGAAGSVEHDHHVFDVTADPELTLHAKGNGVANDAPAIQAALDKAGANGGGVVYLPAGTYNLATTGINIRPGVVLQGHSASDAKIIFGPTTQQPSSFAMTGITIPDNAALTGIADLSIQNVDALSQFVNNMSTRGGSLSKFFIQRVNWNLGTGRSLYLSGDRIAVENSTITQANNNQGIQPDGSGSVGPIYWVPVSNLVFTNNIISWWTGENLFNQVDRAFIDSNHFTRNADTIVAAPAQTSQPFIAKAITVGQKIQRTQGRPLTINIGRNINVTHNIFDVANGPLYYNWNDGETILNEAVGYDDMGVLASANASSATAQPKSAGSWNYFSNSMIIIVSGKGAGQWRHITQNSNNTFTVDQPWLVIPSAGDHFVISVPSFENALIDSNTMTGNPIGIGLYKGAFLNTRISFNTLTDNGGIYLQPFDASGSFSVSRNIEIDSNTITNTQGFTPAYIDLSLAMVQHNEFWGYNMLGVEVRWNTITGHPGTYPWPWQEGFQNYVVYQNSAPYVEQGASALVGNIFQNNTCKNCTPDEFLLTTGALDTVIWHTNTSDSPGVSSILLKDYNFAGTTTVKSVGTLIGP